MRIPTGNGIVRNRQTAGQMSSAVTESAVNMGKMAVNLADKIMDQRAESLAQETRNGFQQKMNDLTMKYQQKKGKDAIGSTKEFMDEAQSLEKEMTGNLGKRSVSKLGDFTTRVNESYRMGMMQHERQQELEFNKGEYEKGVTIAQDMIRQDAKNYPAAVDHLDQTMEAGLKAGLWNDEEHLTKKTEMANKFRQEIGKTYYTQDKHSFMKEIGNFGFGKPEVESFKQKYKNDLDAEARERKSLYSEEAKLIFGKKDDMKAQSMANGETSHFFEGADKLEKMGYKEWANDLREEGNTYKEVVNFKSQNRAKPLAEQLKAVNELEIGSDLDGSSSKFKAHTAIKTEMAKAMKVYNKDPAGYVSQFAQGSNMEEVASSRLSLQEAQGIYPEKGLKVLTSDENQNLKGSWEAGDQRQRAELVLGVKEKFGKHTSKVLSEIGINQAVTLAPYLDDEKDVEMLVAGVSTKPEMLDGSKKGDYSSAAKSSDFYKTLTKAQSLFPTNPDLPQKISDIEAAMTGIAARKVDPAAGAAFFDERFETVDSKDKVIYFPKDKDSDEIEDTLDSKKEAILAQYKSGSEGKDNLSRWAIRDAVWVNSGKGFVLADPRSGAYIPGSEVDMMNPESSIKVAPVKKPVDYKVSQALYIRR